MENPDKVRVGKETAADLKQGASVDADVVLSLLACPDLPEQVREKYTELLKSLDLSTRVPSIPISPKEYRNSNNSLPPGSRFWVLIVGNNDYLHNQLTGCIHDGLLVQEYCKKYLGVPDANIRFLRNATRESMINALYDLRDNDNIQHGDVVLFHYSGNGSIYDPYSHKALCPIDRGKSVPDISDKELNNILNEVHNERGANIVVILDLSYMGSMVRNPEGLGNGFAIRYTAPMTNHWVQGETWPLDFDIMVDAADTHPRRRKGTPVIKGGPLARNIDSMVLLASCHELGSASEGLFEVPEELNTFSESVGGEQEHDKLPKHYGRFTWALINVLTSKPGSEITDMTFEDLIESIGRIDGRQVPIALGGRKTSRVWFADEM